MLHIIVAITYRYMDRDGSLGHENGRGIQVQDILLHRRWYSSRLLRDELEVALHVTDQAEEGNEAGRGRRVALG